MSGPSGGRHRPAGAHPAAHRQHNQKVNAGRPRLMMMVLAVPPTSVPWNYWFNAHRSHLPMQDLTVVFDLDGTLVDTAPDLMRCANYALDLAGVPPVDDAALRPIISHGARAMIERGLSVHGATRTQGEIDRLFKRFIDHYVATISKESRPFPGLLDVLDELEAKGARLAVCTNKLAGMSQRLLDDLDMKHRFRFIAGRDTFPHFKPHPAHLLRTIEQAGGRADRAIMVGDSDVDLATARAAKVPLIAVSFGYSDPPVATLGPDVLIDHYDAFPAALQKLLAGSLLAK
jgi:phosphoglycolate phosphatase